MAKDKQAKEPDAIELLMDQHREVEDIFSDLEDAEVSEKAELFNELADKLAVHAEIEEEYFYPAVKEKKTEEMVLEAFVEHTGVKRLLADLLSTAAAAPAFDARIKVLKELVEHHVKEEEDELFPAAKKVLSADELLAVGQQMTALQVELEQQEPRTMIPGEVAAQPPGS